MEATIGLALRSLLWIVLMPGIVAGYVPWRYFGLREARLGRVGPLPILGLAGFIAGVLLLIACVWEFARSGRGTLSPVDPPRELVVRGLYRYVRNPMYLAVSLILLGEALAVGSWGLLLYWLVFFILANVFVVGYEEPNLRRRFGASYDRYTSTVGRWTPRLPQRGAQAP
jgi:protein-S-isoprenylcysteine O-methyltransferase Ste14